VTKIKAEVERIRAPGFKVTDAEGDTIRLADFKGKKHVVLVFNRGFG